MVQIAGLVDLPVWLFFPIVSALLIYVYGSSFYELWSTLGIRGPPASPFVGNAIRLWDQSLGSQLVIRLWQRQYGRIFGIYIFREPILVITDQAALTQVLVNNSDNFKIRWFCGGGTLQHAIVKRGVFFEEIEDWESLCRIVSPAFSHKNLQSLMHHITVSSRALGDYLSECVQNGEMVESESVFDSFSLQLTCKVVLGVDITFLNNSEIPVFKHSIMLMKMEKTTQLLLFLSDLFPPLINVLHKLGICAFKNGNMESFKNKIIALIAERKANPELRKHMNFLQLLIDAEADCSEDIVGAMKLVNEETTVQGILFIIAGYETISATLQYLTYELARHPDIQDKIVAEIEEVLVDNAEPTYETCQKLKYMEAVINETLRCYPPIHFLTRKAEKEMKLKDFTIPPNTNIIVPIWNIMHDPEYFPDPHSFKPERFLQEDSPVSTVSFLPYGFGPRKCIGSRLARLELQMALVHILRRVEIVGAVPEILEEDRPHTVHTWQPVKLHLKPR